MNRTFSPSEAAFEGFRLVSRKPGLIAAWAIIDLLIGAVVLGLFWLVIGPDIPSFMQRMAEARTAAVHGASDPTLADPVILKIRALQWIINPVAIFVSVVMTAAVYRVLLRPKDSAFAYLRIGADEFRMLAVLIVYWIICMAVAIGVLIVGGIIGAVGYAAFNANHVLAWFWPVLVLACVALVCASIWIGVRLSLALPITFAQRRIALFDSWRLTRGRFWSIFGCYVLTLIFVLVVELLAVVVLFALLMFGIAFLLPALKSGGAPNLGVIGPILLPLGFIWIAVAAGLSAVIRAVVTAPSAAIYQALNGNELATVGDDFTPPEMLVL